VESLNASSIAGGTEKWGRSLTRIETHQGEVVIKRGKGSMGPVEGVGANRIDVLCSDVNQERDDLNLAKNSLGEFKTDNMRAEKIPGNALLLALEGKNAFQGVGFLKRKPGPSEKSSSKLGGGKRPLRDTN